ncbi:STAS domain-containing protein [Nonomuraea rhodomycinica]|uniref:STAS domain-containing protein n=1 Tax=Nonomuraea rhodomycinica TaxID=1712872 RepID=A0A7Y6IPD6_9ACTN|nr:STAS domain-containing protein [Nonomuraea rhodomycinica]NUW41865.1 STAS domain-containing protein [Nonomuraea rhodomycinica]
METLSLRRRRLPGVILVAVGGELDVLTAGRFGAFAGRARRPGQHLVLDLTATTFLSCHGLRALLEVGDDVRHDGGVTRLAALLPGPLRLVRLLHADALVPVHATVEDALSAAAARPPAPGHEPIAQ